MSFSPHTRFGSVSDSCLPSALEGIDHTRCTRKCRDRYHPADFLSELPKPVLHTASLALSTTSSSGAAFRFWWVRSRLLSLVFPFGCLHHDHTRGRSDAATFGSVLSFHDPSRCVHPIQHHQPPVTTIRPAGIVAINCGSESADDDPTARPEHWFETGARAHFCSVFKRARFGEGH